MTDDPQAEALGVSPCAECGGRIMPGTNFCVSWGTGDDAPLPERLCEGCIASRVRRTLDAWEALGKVIATRLRPRGISTFIGRWPDA